KGRTVILDSPPGPVKEKPRPLVARWPGDGGCAGGRAVSLPERNHLPAHSRSAPRAPPLPAVAVTPPAGSWAGASLLLAREFKRREFGVPRVDLRGQGRGPGALAVTIRQGVLELAAEAELIHVLFWGSLPRFLVHPLGDVDLVVARLEAGPARVA